MDKHFSSVIGEKKEKAKIPSTYVNVFILLKDIRHNRIILLKHEFYRTIFSGYVGYCLLSISPSVVGSFKKS